jgi:hypothetical protein
MKEIDKTITKSHFFRFDQEDLCSNLLMKINNRRRKRSILKS